MDGDFSCDLVGVLSLLSEGGVGEEAKGATYSSLGALGGVLHRAYERLELAAHRCAYEGGRRWGIWRCVIFWEMEAFTHARNPHMIRFWTPFSSSRLLCSEVVP